MKSYITFIVTELHVNKVAGTGGMSTPSSVEEFLNANSILNMPLLKTSDAKETNLRPCLRLEYATSLSLEWAS